jgi:colicin import membrane protein
VSAGALFARRDDPGFARSIALAAAVHLVLFAILLVGVRWQNRPPQAVVVELWQAPAPPPKVEERPEPPKPAPKVEPPPPPPKPEPEPRIEKPEIAQKEPPKPKPAPKPKPKPEPKPIAKPEPKPAPPRDAEAQKRMREELAREQQQLALARERDSVREQLAREAASARDKALATWKDRIRLKIRANIVQQPDIKGNPEAIFDVVQLPTGEVLQAKLRKPSGHKAYDEAVERAIWKSSPLPKPDRPELFQRTLELRFRPLDPL